MAADVTRLLNEIQQGNHDASQRLLPLIYEELRKLASIRLGKEKPGQTLQATALVHEAYLRLVDGKEVQHWNSRGHFFCAAAESMRRILVDQARKKATVKRGGNLRKVDLDSAEIATMASPESMLEIDEAINRLSAEQPTAAKLVQLRYFAGLSIEDAAKALGVSSRSAYRHWTYARSWMFKELLSDDS